MPFCVRLSVASSADSGSARRRRRKAAGRAQQRRERGEPLPPELRHREQVEHALESMKLDLVVFGTDGGILRRLITEMAPVRPAKTDGARILWSMPSAVQIGAILVNDVTACAPEASPAPVSTASACRRGSRRCGSTSSATRISRLRRRSLACRPSCATADQSRGPEQIPSTPAGTGCASGYDCWSAVIRNLTNLCFEAADTHDRSRAHLVVVRANLQAAQSRRVRAPAIGDRKLGLRDSTFR